MGEVVPARTSPTLHPPSPPTVHGVHWKTVRCTMLTGCVCLQQDATQNALKTCEHAQTFQSTITYTLYFVSFICYSNVAYALRIYLK